MGDPRTHTPRLSETFAAYCRGLQRTALSGLTKQFWFTTLHSLFTVYKQCSHVAGTSRENDVGGGGTLGGSRERHFGWAQVKVRFLPAVYRTRVRVSKNLILSHSACCHIMIRAI